MDMIAGVLALILAETLYLMVLVALLYAGFFTYQVIEHPRKPYSKFLAVPAGIVAGMLAGMFCLVVLNKLGIALVSTSSRYN
jgi:TRAP-type C4-dicarboxylate transport system permease small subunit